MSSNTEKTKAPTGLKIVRNRGKFTLSWKIGDKDYKDGQWFSYMVDDTGKDKWTSADRIGVSTTAKSITVDKKDFYPNKNKYLFHIKMRVKGNRDKYTTGSGSKKKDHNPGTSHWSDKSFELKVPRKPSLSVALDSTFFNVSTFSWSVNTSDEDTHWFTDVEWQTILVPKCLETTGKKLSWKSSTLGWKHGTGGSSGSYTRTEDTTTLAKGSYTRWFRIRSRGPRGHSDWVYAKHVYAVPNSAKISAANAKKDSSEYNCKVVWSAPTNAAYPIDQTIVQYAIETPIVGLGCPAGASWSDGSILKDTKGKDAAVFPIDGTVDLDQCLFVRVNTQHDYNINYGTPSRVIVESLSLPTDLSVSDIDSTNFTATVSATNNSSVPDSFLVVAYRRSSAPKKDLICGIIPYGGSSTTVKVPNWNSEATISFGVYAVQGSYKRIQRTDGVTEYSVKSNTSSQSVWSSTNIPKAPENVSASYNSSGQMEVTWDWTWKVADSFDISWSDSPLAWQSTSEPEVFSVDQKATRWYISGLEQGKIWYIRVRLKQGEVESPWSKVISASTAKQPLTPIVSLSDPRITTRGSTTISWTYVSRDTTEQSYATVAVRTRVNNTYKYTPIAHTETSKGITLYAESLGWTAGSSYDLCVMVTSESNMKSNWSNPVTVNIATPLTASISQTSLQTISFVDEGDYTVTAQNTQNIDSIEIDAETFEEYTQSGTGTYLFSYSNEQWYLQGSAVDLNLYGIDAVVADIGEESYNVTVQNTQNIGSIEVDVETFGEYTQLETGTYLFSYAEEQWTLQGSIVDLDLYGISIAMAEGAETASIEILAAIPPKTASIEVLAVLPQAKDVLSLVEMPLSVVVTGAGAGGTTVVAIERTKAYYLERPDENKFTGFEGETIVAKTQTGESAISISAEELIGTLDDGAEYEIIATVKDGLGQSDETRLRFEVHWSHQALEPSATVVIDEENLIAKITPIADEEVLFYYALTTDTSIIESKTYYTRSGTGTEQDPYVYTAVQSPSAASLSSYYEKLSYGDVADIYRLSIDKPELIVRGAQFGTTYVDPYPALGDMGGHRIVLRTANGDYITQDNQLAMVDSPELGVNPIENEEQWSVIDFEGKQIRFYWNVDYSNSWKKSFQETQYLGGSVQGDWNLSVSRTGTINTQAITVLDQDMLQAVRRLAEYSGICHVRTPDGSSFAADVQVSEDRNHTDQEMKVNYSLSITRVNAQGFDGMTLAQWEDETQES